MASAPEGNPDPGRTHGEEEPLLGQPGDANQPEGKGLELNFILGEELLMLEDHYTAAENEREKFTKNSWVYLGTGIIAQAGIWIVGLPAPNLAMFYMLTTSQLTITIWVDILKSPYSLFTPHPLLNSAGLLLTTQAILLLQPTHTPKQKRDGANVHGILNSLSVLTLIAALAVIEANKYKGGMAHLYSPHAILGLITYILFFLQAIVGITQYWFPSLYGGEDNAKALYKYHRASGYVLILLSLIVVALATQTSFNKKA
ncbi:uncharacterized protein KY384_007094 [Bacidia gigantensis]|uniref:uncharacterized protein n=1 Tax=Bacidia gigantensis TaxID=2732470 RepID=UPI001D03A838|nr:uncharacterized protein KY384_007094 [Bacidia gigantensis]KAG8528177.1 hypothetical protein KY384_007094 [Bacidia gigantensis]